MTQIIRNELILGMRVDETSIKHSMALIQGWAERRESKNVVVSNVHMCMEAFDCPAFQHLINEADLVVPDGKPLAIGMRLLGAANTEQVRGANLTRALLDLVNNKHLIIGLYGGSEAAVIKFMAFIKNEYPSAETGCAISPPFRALTEQEDRDIVQKINDAGVQILFVGLGCPKQEKWMAEHKERVNAVMIGVGAVFDFLSGTRKEAPSWVQHIGLEWFFRLTSEPKRLWRRYMILNPRFVWHFGKQLLKAKTRSDV